MSAAVTSFGAEIPAVKSGSARSNDCRSRIDGHATESPAIGDSGQRKHSVACYKSACDPDLVSAAQNGDQRAFVELCERHTPSLKRKIRRILRNREDAEDVLQDTLIRAFIHLAGFRATCSFRTWIMTIATNTSLMLLRKRRNHPEGGFGLVTAEGKEIEVLQISDPMPNPEEVFAKRQARHRVSQAVRMLPPAYRLIVERYHQDEVRLIDAANAIGITVAAAKSRLLRARIALRRHLNNDSLSISQSGTRCAAAE
jgi:RNA polymerase sigma-70 factor (ECF subfamily)